MPGVGFGNTFTVSVVELQIPVVGLPLSGFPVGGYVCGFLIRGTPA